MINFNAVNHHSPLKPIALFLAAYLFLGSFFPGMDFSQLTRLDDLIEHYHFHKQNMEEEGAALSFLQYFSIHLFNPNGHYHQHGNPHSGLPLQSIHSFIDLGVCQSCLFLAVPKFSFESPQPVFPRMFYTFEVLSAIFRPPIGS